MCWFMRQEDDVRGFTASGPEADPPALVGSHPPGRGWPAEFGLVGFAEFNLCRQADCFCHIWVFESIACSLSFWLRGAEPCCQAAAFRWAELRSDGEGSFRPLMTKCETSLCWSTLWNHQMTTTDLDAHPVWTDAYVSQTSQNSSWELLLLTEGHYAFGINCCSARCRPACLEWAVCLSCGNACW